MNLIKPLISFIAGMVIGNYSAMQGLEQTWKVGLNPFGDGIFYFFHKTFEYAIGLYLTWLIVFFLWIEIRKFKLIGI